jgi:hypothetical protein
MKSWRCPNCKAWTVVPGHCWNGELVVYGFVPTQTRTNGVSLKHSFLCCALCGHVWANVDPQKLRACIEENGSELVRERIDPRAIDPFRGLPECPEAHTAAEGVDEIDGLVLEGKIVEAIRRYRELTHARWGQAGDDVRAWHDLNRVTKLAKFGWQSKDAIIKDESLAKHPMRDPWLDG